MIINIKQPLSFSEIGRKDNQEDFRWPNPETVTKNQRVFIMCDGVGGQESGEVASQTAGTALGEYLTANWPEDGYVRKEHFEAALSHAYDALDAVDNGSTRKMATTMTCIAIHRGGVLVAHIGDSRVYQLRPSLANAEMKRSGVVYQTEDHSLVNDLLRVGELTAEEAVNFPQKNVITRAMQPNQENRCRADIYNITDVKTGDYFFLCCDGVLEQLSNLKLGTILANASLDNDEKILAIKEVCDGNTHDNYTCWLVPVGKVEVEDSDSALEIDEETVASIEDTDGEEDFVEAAPKYEEAEASTMPAAAKPARPVPPAPQPAKTRSVSTITVATIIVAIIAIAGVAAAYFLRSNTNGKTVVPVPTEVTTPDPADNAKPAATEGAPAQYRDNSNPRNNVNSSAPAAQPSTSGQRPDAQPDKSASEQQSLDGKKTEKTNEKVEQKDGDGKSQTVKPNPATQPVQSPKPNPQPAEQVSGTQHT